MRSSPGVVLKVPHRGTMKMVGKCFKAGGVTVIYHEDTTGSQWHVATDSPGGIDAQVLDFARAGNISAFHHEVQGMLYVTDRETIETYAIREQSDGRDRYYLPASFWSKTRRGYRVPWITRVVILPKVKSDA